MTDQIFISHSRKEKKIMDYFAGKFTDTGIRPVCIEYELWSREGRPNWRWIKDEIQKSKMLFLILTRNLTKTEYTQNWVAFEVGVALAFRSLHDLLPGTLDIHLKASLQIRL